MPNVITTREIRPYSDEGEPCDIDYYAIGGRGVSIERDSCKRAYQTRPIELRAQDDAGQWQLIKKGMSYTKALALIDTLQTAASTVTLQELHHAVAAVE